MADNGKEKKPRKNRQAVRLALARQYAANNERCARIILSNSQKYAGLPTVWAWLVLRQAKANREFLHGI